MIENFENFVNGIVIVYAKDANFNADMSGYPRRLPDGMFFATDKALKYCIRKYWHDFGENVIFWRRYRYTTDKKNKNKKIIVPFDFDTNLDKLLKNLKNQEINKRDVRDIVKNVISLGTDVRVFGGTFTLKSESKQTEGNNFSLTGPCQITYGLDRYGNGDILYSQILSPKPSSEAQNQFTMGSEVRLTEAHYVFDFTINPNNFLCDEYLMEVFGRKDKIKGIQKKDVEKLKDALIHSVTYTTSTTKNGAITSLLLWIEYKKHNDGTVSLTPYLRDKIKIKEDKKSGKRIVECNELKETIDLLLDEISRIELYYNPDIYDEINKKDLSSVPSKVKIFYI